MSSGEVRRVSREDIQLVQNLIERCLQLYMNQKEVVETLLAHAKIEPGFTELVWQKLEEENREFFKAYHVRLTVKNQIMIFNKLLGEQAELMRNTCPVGVGSVPMSNGSNPPSLHQAGSFMSEQRMQPSRSENVNHLMGPSNMAVNGRPSVHGSLQSSDESSAHNGRMGISTNMLVAQNSHMSMPHGLNQIVIKSETGYSNSSPFTFGLNGNILDTRSTIGESFSSVGSNSQPLNPPLVDTEASSFGFLGQIPRNFSLSDLTADFSQSTDIMESYSRSPFLPDADDFLNSPGRNCQDDAKILDTISEGLNFEEFGSD